MKVSAVRCAGPQFVRKVGAALRAAGSANSWAGSSAASQGRKQRRQSGVNPIRVHETRGNAFQPPACLLQVVNDPPVEGNRLNVGKTR